MTVPLATQALLQFIDDEMLRAPLLFDQVVEGTIDRVRKALPELTPLLRSAASEMVQAMQARQAQMADYFTRSLREQVQAELGPASAPHAVADSTKPTRGLTLSLVDEDEVAVDVQLAHVIEAIKSTAEYELRELQTYTAALVGDMHMARDHNPFRAETYARALWAAAQALPLSRGHQVVFMRHAGEPLAMLLRQAYAASASRLEAMGVEPAAYRTLILPAGSRRGRASEETYSPDLQRMREIMPLPPEVAPPEGLSYEGQQAAGRRGEPAAIVPSQGERQALELVNRLFEAIRADTRVPPDVLALIQRLHGPALRLVQRESTQLADDAHPMWAFVNRLAYEAEMAPDPADPERVRLLQVAQATIQQLASEPEQKTSLYHWAGERLDTFLRQRLARRCTAASSQIGALQRLEDKLTAGQTVPTTLHGTLDVQQLDTVPAELMPDAGAATRAPTGHEDWLDELRPGEWIRMFLQGNWVHVQVLWPGERREIWLFGDGASDATWAVLRRALVTLHGAGLLKSLTRRSLVRRAARQVHEQVTAAPA